MSIKFLVFSLLISLAFSAMILTSPEFKNFGNIPGDYGCDIITGEDRDPFKPSPPLEWVRPPAKTQSYVLLVDDMDNNDFIHWLVINIPRNITTLDTDASGVAMPEGAIELKNSYGINGWGGPCPLDATHQYRFRLFAMRTPTVDIVIPSNISELRSSIIENQLIDPIYVAVLTANYHCPIYIPPIPPAISIPKLSSVPEPIPMIRYFKPSESFRASKNAHKEIEKRCRPGQDGAQLCKQPPEFEPPVPVIKSPIFPFPNEPVQPTVPSNLQPDISSNKKEKPISREYKTTSTDPASQLSPEEALRRHVRLGGLEAINPRQGTGLLIPEEDPNIVHKTPLQINEMPNTTANGEDMNKCGNEKN